MNQTQAYPLQWPSVKPRTKSSERKAGLRKNVTVAKARDELTKQMNQIGSDRYVISSNGVLGKNGQLLSKQPKLTDPGVAVYFWIKGQFYILSCDQFIDMAVNLRAIASVLHNARQVGYVLGIEKMYDVLAAITDTGKPPPRQKPSPNPEPKQQQPPPRQEKKQTPPPKPPPDRKADDWRTVLQLGIVVTYAQVQANYRQLAKQYHPDKPEGSTEAFQKLQTAYEAAKKYFGYK